jgi:hypothetical protein
MPDASVARRLAAIGGALYLLIIVVGFAGEALIRGSIVAEGNASLTGTNLRAMDTLWRLGVAGEGVLLLATVGLAVILYVLLSPIDRRLAQLAILLNVCVVAIEGVAAVSLATALLPMGTTGYLDAFTPAQRDVMATLAIRSHSIGFAFALIFFGAECLVLGVLITRSGYLPRILGRLMHLAGACYLVNSFSLILSPRFASLVFPAILLPALVAELSLALWLLLKGVRASRWDEWRSVRG